MILYISKNNPLAVTYDSDKNIVECWHAPEYKSEINLRVFEDKNGKKRILASDDGYRWNREKKEAHNCEYATIWFGAFPYGSWCIAIRVSNNKDVSTSFFDTEINYRGVLPVDRWVEECK